MLKAAEARCKSTPGRLGKDCLPALLVVLYVESRWQPAPRRRGSGCGAGQALPNVPFLMDGWRRRTPSCTALERPKVGVLWAVRILEAKLNRCSRSGPPDWPCGFARYNGSARRAAYAARVTRLFELLRRAHRRGVAPLLVAP